MPLRMRNGLNAGCLALIGGGEFSFGETIAADAAWVSKLPAGPVAFLPTASGSAEYGQHFAGYLGERFQRSVEIVPVYRRRDAKRSRNLERLEGCVAVYIGGGVADTLIEVLENSPVLEALERKLSQGGVVVGIAAAAQAFGLQARSISRGKVLRGLGWLQGGVIDPNFDPGHDRRLRELMRFDEVQWGLGIAAGSAVLVGPEGNFETVGSSFLLEGVDADYSVLGGHDSQ